VLVANPFNAMGAEPIIQNGGALQRLAGNDFTVGEFCFQEITRSNRAARTCVGDHATEFVALFHHLFQHFQHRRASDFIMPQIVAKLFKLVEDDQILP